MCDGCSYVSVCAITECERVEKHEREREHVKCERVKGSWSEEVVRCEMYNVGFVFRGVRCEM